MEVVISISATTRCFTVNEHEGKPVADFYARGYWSGRPAPRGARGPADRSAWEYLITIHHP